MDNIKDDQYYLNEILVYCSFISENSQKYTDNQICDDRNILNSILLDILNIGENANHISDAFKKSHQNIPWNKMISLRNIIAHDYGDIDYPTIIDIIHRDIPKLQSWINNLLQIE